MAASGKGDASAKNYKSALRSLSPDELEFLAGDELVKIMPMESHKKLHFRGTYGPLVAGTLAVVPLWLALMLKRRNKAKISCPQWMTVTSLEKTLSDERSEDEFATLPFFYVEIAAMILSEASDDMGYEADRMRSLIEDIETVRKGKIYTGMGEAAQRQDIAIKVKGISAMELRPVRTFFSSALSSMYEISGAKSRAEEARTQRLKPVNAQEKSKPESGIVETPIVVPKTSRLRRFR